MSLTIPSTFRTLKAHSTTPQDDGGVLTVTALAMTRGFMALVDPEDFERFCHIKWYPQANRRTTYATCGNGVFLHRLILNAPKGVCVDHINGDGLDNRRSNLRFATRTENARNSGGRTNKHGFKGIAGCEYGYYGRVKANGRQYVTKTVRTPKEAAILRDELALALHGEFAALNFEFRRVA